MLYLSHSQAVDYVSRVAGMSRETFDEDIRPRLFERRYSPRVTRFSKAAIDAALENPKYIERPPGEVEIEKLREFARPFTFWTGIYFLFLDDELVYVGQALHIPSRLCDHVPGVNRD